MKFEHLIEINDPLNPLMDTITRYWTVIEKNSLLLPWDFSGNSPGVFLYNRCNMLLPSKRYDHAQRAFNYMRIGNQVPLGRNKEGAAGRCFLRL